MYVSNSFEKYGFGAQETEILDFLQTLLDSGYRETDMQFNIARIEGSSTNKKRIDLVNPFIHDRVLIAQEGDPDSENLILRELGSHALFNQIEQVVPNFNIYQISSSSRLAIKTLRSSPYSPDYMRVLESRVNQFLGRLGLLDENSFGITINDIAITHNGSDYEDDDIHFTIVPPISPLVVGAPDARNRKR